MTDCCLRKIDANLENYTAKDFRSQINPVQAKWVIKWVTRARNNTLSTPVWWIAANICGKESAKEADSAHFVSLLPEEILHHVSTHLALKEMQIPRSADFSVITTLSLPSLTRKHNSRISELRHLPYLAFLILSDSEITDDSLRNLRMGLQLQGSADDWKGIWRLRGIWLDGSRGISDKSIKNLWRFPMLNVISKHIYSPGRYTTAHRVHLLGVSRTSVTDAGHSMLQAISAETNHRYFKANRLHAELALPERPVATIKSGTVQDRIYKGYHRLWPQPVGWEGSPEYPSYRVHVCGDPVSRDPVYKTRANGVEHEASPTVNGPRFNTDRYPTYSIPAIDVDALPLQQHSSIPSKRFVSARSAAGRAPGRTKKVVADNGPPSGVSQQTVLFGMLIREAIDENALSADSIRKNLMATIAYDKKVKAKIVVAAAPEPPKVGMFGIRPGADVDISQWHIPITKAGHRDQRYGNRAKHNATKALTSALAGCPGLTSSQSTSSASSQATVSTSQGSSFFSSQSTVNLDIPSTPRKFQSAKPLGRLASASQASSEPDDAPPAKKPTGYGMFRKK